MRHGVRIGIDVGKSRVGVARTDPAGLMAVPVATLARATALDDLVTMTDEYGPLEFVCGLPVGLNARETLSTSDAREFAAQLHVRTGVPVRLLDERLTTVAAQQSLHQAAHTVHTSRAVIDQVAATILLETALDAERAGNEIGDMVGEQ
jgi:putative Holliday junction resolvase